jgi:phosphatidylserine/phosphatidylglycerophosphate/cardiolipin synthase-like enzyme
MDNIRLQKHCHNKGIVVDSSIAVLGSHNWTNEGMLFNRDASLIVFDPDVAAYFEQIFRFDWEFLAKQESDEAVPVVRVAAPGEATPPGMRRVPMAEFFDTEG